MAVVAFFIFASTLQAQDHTVLFSAGDPGVSKAITNWGVSVTWPNYHNTRLSLLYMGDDVDFMHLAFVTSQPLTNGNLTAAMQADLQGQADMANMAGAKPWSMAIGTGSGVHAWYTSGGDVIASRWVQAMEAAQRFYNKPIIYVEPFNEPDYGWGQGTMANLYDIMGLLQTSTNFTGTILAGGSTLNADWANPWYDAVKSRATAGTSHALSGSFNNYVGFMQNVIASGDLLILPEAHSMMEVIAGAEYGVNRDMIWGANEITRASFVKACQGKRLGYSEDRAKWTAAAVYRGTNGLMQAFLSGTERMGVSTSYRFFSKDRDVFYNGDGPRRDFTVSVAAFDDKLVNISSGPDVPPSIVGRFVIVNRNSGKVMEVAGASTADSANVQQNASTAGTYQQWDVAQFLPAGGDQGYYSIKAAHSGKALDVSGGSTGAGANVQQWTNGGGEEQIIETSPLPVGQWRHVAVTRNGNTAKLYTNGVVAASSASFTIPPANFNPVLNYLGASQWPDPLFNGRLDEVFIYNYALSDTEITRLSTNLPPPPVAPTSLTTSFAGNSLLISWPTNYLGCRLESNSVSLSAPGNWFTVSGSAATNQMTLPINPSSLNVFFRLVYP